MTPSSNDAQPAIHISYKEPVTHCAFGNEELTA